MVLKNLFTEQQWRHRHREQTDGHGETGERVRHMERVTWKQPRCPSTDEWIKKLWYIYTVEYYSAIKRNTFESVLTRWINLEPIIQSEVYQKRKINIVFYCIYTESRKMVLKNLFTRQQWRNRHRG